MDISKYKGMFISETKEHLQTMNQLIVSLEKEPSNQESIEALFREAHSIKGMAASMGYQDISDLSHKMEDMMDLFRKGELSISSDAVDVLFEGLDALEIMVKGVEDDQPAEMDTSSIISMIDSIKEGGSGAPGPEEVEEEKPVEIEALEVSAIEPLSEEGTLKVEVEISASAQIPGMRGFLVFKRLDEIGEILSLQPDIEDIKKGNFDRKLTLGLTTDRDAKEVEDIIASIPELSSYNVSSDSAEANVATDTEKVEETEKKGPDKSEIKVKSPSRKGHQVRTVRVSTDLLDQLINIVGEMIIARSRLFEVSRESESIPLKDGIVNMGNLIRDLHDQVMSVRMTPVENVMERLPRMVRDLARKNGKKVDLIIEGKDIELDRAILDEMGDPLVHMLRNCVDHGIETPDERKSAGKEPAGKLLVRAMRERDQVILNIEDDGRGMDPEKIKKKAVERGIIDKAKAEMMDDREALMLVCRSGVSTADEVTDVSGRGVGMDVVKNVVDSIGGIVEIGSTTGKGTNITIKLPLTVAIVQVLLVRFSGEIFAIPINKIIRTIEIQRNELKRSQRQLAALVEGELIPLLSLKKILKIEAPENPAPLVSIAVVEIKNKKVGLVVDALIAQQEVFIKPLEPPLKWVKGLSGATILGDGSVIFVLDIPNLM